MINLRMIRSIISDKPISFSAVLIMNTYSQHTNRVALLPAKATKVIWRHSKMMNFATFIVPFLIINFGNVFTEETPEHFPPQRVEPDPDLEKYLREAIENFREQMKVGIPAIKMPILDPLELKNLDINVDENLANLNLKIRKITVLGLSEFNFREIYPDLEDFYMECNFTLPRVTSFGKYDLNGKLLKIFPLRGNGDFQINITTAEIAGVGKLDFVEDTLQMTKLKLELTWGKLDIVLENFLGGGRFSDVLQKLIPAIGKSVFDNFKPKILDLMNTALMNEVNKELRKPEVKNIIEGILPGKE